MEQNNLILDISETASEGNMEPTMQQLILSGEGIPVNISLKHPITDCTAAQMSYIESEEKSLNVNCSNLDKLTSLMLPVQDEDSSETPVQLSAAMYKPAEIVPEVITHNANLNICDSKGRSPMRFADQVKSTLRKELTDILLNHLSLQVRQPEEGFDCSSDTELPLSGSCIGWEQKNCTNIDFSTCGSEVFSEDAKNSLTNTATELASGSNSRNILLYFHTAKQTLQKMIEVYKELEMSSQDTSLENSWKYLSRPKERHSSLPDNILLTPGRLRRRSSLNITRRSSYITKVPGLEIGRQMQGSQSEPSITDTEMHFDSLPTMKTQIQQSLQNGNNETIKVALPQLNTNTVRTPIPVRLAPLQRKIALDISNTILLSTPSKPSRLPALTSHISITKTKRMKIQALPQDHGSKGRSEYDSGGISGNSNSLDMVETSQSLVIQTSERRDDIENNCKLNLPSSMHVDESMGFVDTKCSNELHLIQENDKYSCSNHANYLAPIENRVRTASGSDESKSKCKESNTTEIILSSEEVVHTNCCKDITVLLDSINNEDLNYQLSKRSDHVGEHVEGNTLKSIARNPGQSTNLENICNKRAGNLVFLCRQEIHPSDDLFEADIAEDVITQNSSVQNPIENLGENITAPETIMGTECVTCVKEKNVAHKDVQTGSKGIPVIYVTLANQPHSKSQKFSRQTPIKRRDNGYITAHDANHSFNVLAQNERGAKKKIAKSNVVNQRNSSSIPARNKLAYKTLQCLSVPKQNGSKQNVHLQPNVRSVKSKQDPSFPLMENAGLNQISSKVQLKPQIKCLLKNGSVPKKSLPHINRSATSLSKPSVPPIPRSHSLADFSELKYCDMFQEIYPVDEGPGIYEMFGTPVYSILRESTALDSNDQGVHSTPRRRASTCENPKSNKLTGRNSAKNIKKNSKNNRNCTNIQKTKVGISQNQEKIPSLLNSDEEQGDIVIISGCVWHTKTSRSEAVIGNANRQEDSGHCPDFSEPYYSTDVYQVEKQNLSTITEASLEQVSVRTGGSVNILQESDHNCAKEGEVEHNPINDSNDIMLQKSNHMDSFATNLLELKNHPSKGDVEIIQTCKGLGCQNNTDESESTTLLPSGLNLKIADDEAESATLCIFGNQNNTTSSEGRVTADLDSNPASFPGQPLRNKWTAETPSRWFECPSQDDLTSELLSCLASALLLEENDTNEQALQVVTNVQEKVNQKTGENLPPNENKGMIDFCRTEEKNEINIQNPESRILTKLWSTPGSNSCLDNSIKSECSSISYDEAITWTKGNILGKGASGTVYCGLTSQGQLIAVKQVAPDTTNHITAEKEHQKLQEEVELLKNLKHINIVSFLGTSLEAKVVSIFMEFVPGGSIASVINRFGPLPEAVFCMYTKQIVQGVGYLHDNRVIHRDIKGNNVMLMPNGIIKLIDFGCAKRLACVNMNGTYSEVLKSMHGTPYWMAPEVINETGYGRKSDIWSTGCTVFEMASGKPPLAHMDKIAAMFYIGAHRGPMPHLPEQFSENSRDFVQICLTSDQHKRPSVKQLLQHPFIVRQQRQNTEKTNCSRH